GQSLRQSRPRSYIRRGAECWATGQRCVPPGCPALRHYRGRCCVCCARDSSFLFHQSGVGCFNSSVPGAAITADSCTKSALTVAFISETDSNRILAGGQLAQVEPPRGGVIAPCPLPSASRHSVSRPSASRCSVTAPSGSAWR